ncbi:class I SAM-dependent methyltransferase [Lacinutrix sp. Hel_I_90]|uniref:class I SAM-dependent DNA methyltransferase n=1 Tax=Lacinutrix sp. Hel_I_90 TaxID=1249999 RepID=UPI0005C973D2|nr:class I SAM-dependent methyltransferase [Lacinutrix sp. Hel_I_90]
MQSLYTNGLEHLYDAMYQTFINYEEEYLFYSTLLNKYKKNQVLEMGSGTGNLAKYFVANGFDYHGLDYSADMVALASQKLSKKHFIQGDMRDFKLNQTTQSIIITGRTSSYLLSNKNVHNALHAIYNNLENQGILCFDFIDANRFIKSIKGGVNMEHAATYKQKTYYRESFLTPTTSNNIMFNWNAKYYEVTEDSKKLITQDDSEVRAFTKNEWELFLYLNDFELIECIDKPSYMFDTYVMVARKMAQKNPNVV